MKRTLAIALVLALAAPAVAEEIQRNFDHTFDVKKGDKLHLTHGDGDVVIEPWDEDRIDVKVEYRATIKQVGVGSSPDFEVRFEKKGDTCFVRGIERGATQVGYLSVRLHVFQYTIRAPEWVELEIFGDDGDVEVTDWGAPIRCELSDGDVRLSRCEVERARIEMSDGDLRIDQCTGSFDIENQDGDIVMRSHASGPTRIATQDGDIELSVVKEGVIDLDVRTQDGNVRVELAKGIHAQFEIETGDGWIDVDLEDARTKKRRAGTILGTTGPDDTKGRILIRTQDGHVELREA